MSDLLGEGSFVGDSGHEFWREFDAHRRGVLAHAHARESRHLHAIGHAADEVAQDDPVRRRVRRDVHVEASLVGQTIHLGGGR